MTNKTLETMLNKFMPFAQKRMGFKAAPEIHFESDEANAQDPLGKTAYYEPNNSRITVYTVGRHPKDIMRSISHELVHHTQNGRGAFADSMTVGEQGYAQNDEHLREMEREAYEQGNLCFRDWEDSVKVHQNEELDMFEKRNNKLNERVMKRFGYVNEAHTAADLAGDDGGEYSAGDASFRGDEMHKENEALERVMTKISKKVPVSKGVFEAAKVLYWRDEWPEGQLGQELYNALDDTIGIDKTTGMSTGNMNKTDPNADPYGFLADRLKEVVQDEAHWASSSSSSDEGRGDPHSYKPEDMGYNAGTPLVAKENLGGDYDESYRARLDQAQAGNPEKTMPEIEAMLSGEESEMGLAAEEPIPNSGGEEYEVGDSIRDEDNRTGQVLELTAYGAIAQFESEEGPEKIRFKHMTKSAGNKELARPELGDETGFDSNTELAEYDFEKDEELDTLEEEFPEAFQIVVGENEGGDCAEASIQLVVGEEDDVTVMTQEADEEDPYETRDTRLHEKLTRWSTK